MGRAPCCDKANVKRGPWSPEEDETLRNYVQNYGTGGNWIALPQKAGLRRCGKSCRLRWLNYLRPDIKHGGFTEEEDNIIISLYGKIGSRWSVIAANLVGRTDNDVKNHWNTKLKKKLFGGNGGAGNKINTATTTLNKTHHHQIQLSSSNKIMNPPNYKDNNPTTTTTTTTSQFYLSPSSNYTSSFTLPNNNSNYYYPAAAYNLPSAPTFSSLLLSSQTTPPPPNSLVPLPPNLYDLSSSYNYQNSEHITINPFHFISQHDTLDHHQHKVKTETSLEATSAAGAISAASSSSLMTIEHNNYESSTSFTARIMEDRDQLLLTDFVGFPFPCDISFSSMVDNSSCNYNYGDNYGQLVDHHQASASVSAAAAGLSSQSSSTSHGGADANFC